MLQDEPAYSGPSGDTPGEDSGTTACVLLLFKVSPRFLLRRFVAQAGRLLINKNPPFKTL